MRFTRAWLAIFIASFLLVSSEVARAEIGKPEDHPQSLEICRPIQDTYALGDPYLVDLRPATGRRYKGGKSILVYYKDHFSSTGLSACHFIIRSNKVLHGPHVRFNEPNPPA